MLMNRPHIVQVVHHRHRRLCFVLALACIASTCPALAQTRTGLLDRLEYLEQQVETLKHSSGAAQDAPVRTNVPTKNAAQLEVSLSGMAEEIRYLRGKVEEQEYEVKRIGQESEKFQADVDARLAALEDAQHAAAQAPLISEDTASTEEEETPVVKAQPSGASVVTAKGDGKKSSAFNNASEHYDSAFKLLNESRYDEAAELFASFTKTYPKHELVGNAYYWLGETHYVQHQFADAAEQFRKGFETAPDGAKAPDNLLKLGMSLSQLKRNDEACVVFKQLLKKYPKQSEAVKSKASKEFARMQCK